MDEKVRFAMAMRIGRAALGMSQQEFADMLGVAKSTIARNETLEMVMRAETLTAMIRALRERGVDIDILGSDDVLDVQVREAAVETLKGRLEDESRRRSDRKRPLN
ncbi:transcriptional regulator with XRE-family HTH domain [Marinobacterium sp. MBR-111]|jgi:transcriptional regulator with XRE-family HTH domain|uniref:helix-turn-helix domain-containing protein n=1 Tax=Marinobacterium TaxID=48075 RepID=UPI001A8CF8BE|nr:helix-turn-helix transcriptional regulator [Marinobacterium iners]